MFNQETAKQLFLNSQLWEEITDTQSEAISGGNPPTIQEIGERIYEIGVIVSDTPGYDADKTSTILGIVTTKNGAIKKFFS
ncbi:hypothetical protein H6G06_20675 [Anabaena sphaerica FACHB-251]|uniref:Uncharacterized protein n=1 Tax=Anabaena sphaerica FACHB-251 TaxID=2692883 RepID=A0A927A318_9NOST|nr:hypothetical protein [Anabaena sphaerica]MBD2295821.1 hypothetical protein [Anabaena sphaerica FACHB-251]